MPRAAPPTRRLPRRTAGRTPGEGESSGTWPFTSSRDSLSLFWSWWLSSVPMGRRASGFALKPRPSGSPTVHGAQNERILRSPRTRAAPACPAMHRHVNHCCGLLWVLVVVVVVVVLWCCGGCRGCCCCGCGGCGGCGTDNSEHAVSVQGRAYVQLIGWQNAWEQAPGVPATPSPP